MAEKRKATEDATAGVSSIEEIHDAHAAVKKAKAGVQRAQDDVQWAKDEVRQALAEVQAWKDANPNYSGEEPPFKARVAQLNEADKRLQEADKRLQEADKRLQTAKAYHIQLLQLSREVKKPKHQATLWTTTVTLDLAASTLPLLVDNDRQQQPSVSCWTIDRAAISDFGVRCFSDKLILFRRPDADKQIEFLRDDVVRDGRCGYILGPPGSGKSVTAAAFALVLARSTTSTCATDSWVVTWIHLARLAPPICVRLEGKNVKKTANLDADQDLKLILNEVDDTQNHIVFLDGVTPQNDVEVKRCMAWLLKNRVTRRLVVVADSTSSCGSTNLDDKTALNIQEHFVSPWTLDEYFQAVDEDEFFQIVKIHLDAEQVFDGGNKVSNTGMMMDSITKSWRHSLVESKHHIAGGNARYMFGCPTAAVVASLREDGVV